MTRPNKTVTLMRVMMASMLAGLSAARAAAQTTTTFSDNFSSYPQNSCFADGSAFGPWTSAFSGYGCTEILSSGGSDYLQESPEASTSSSQTHAALVVGPSFNNPITYSVSVNTASQLRQNSTPNAWERAWVLWDYSSNTNFYYLILKTTGWELGKEDPSYPGDQRFLATGTSPTFPLGAWNAVKVVDNQNTMTIYVNGQLLTTFTDTQTPYTSGQIGLYDEDSVAQFESVSVSASAGGSPAAQPPTIASLSPSSAAAGGSAFTLNVSGANFTSDSVVHWNGSSLSSTVAGASSLSAAVTAADIASAGTASVTVVNSIGTSSAVNFTIAPSSSGTGSGGSTGSGGGTAPAVANNPTPSITSLNPSWLMMGSPGFNLTISGSNFVQGSAASWNGTNLTTVSQSATQLVVSVPASEVQRAGAARVSVANPSPGGGDSNSLTFTVTVTPVKPHTLGSS